MLLVGGAASRSGLSAAPTRFYVGLFSRRGIGCWSRFHGRRLLHSALLAEHYLIEGFTVALQFDNHIVLANFLMCSRKPILRRSTPRPRPLRASAISSAVTDPNSIPCFADAAVKAQLNPCNLCASLSDKRFALFTFRQQASLIIEHFLVPGAGFIANFCGSK